MFPLLTRDNEGRERIPQLLGFRFEGATGGHIDESGNLIFVNSLHGWLAFTNGYLAKTVETSKNQSS